MAQMDSEILALQRVDDVTADLQKQGRYLEALEFMEKGLVLRNHLFGIDSKESLAACKTVAELCNLLAMTYLQQEDYKMVVDLLEKANLLTKDRIEAGYATTLNNFACYYRRVGKLSIALNYLQKVLRIEVKLERQDNHADTHLNLTAILSQMGKHTEALEHAQAALIMLQEEIMSTPEPSLDRVSVLVIAYHNMGSEQEFLKRLPEAVKSYQKGTEVGSKHLGATNQLVITLRNALLEAKKKMTRKRKQIEAKKSIRAASVNEKRRSRIPSGKDEQRWESATNAYGTHGGVRPVRRVNKKKPKRSGSRKTQRLNLSRTRDNDLKDMMSPRVDAEALERALFHNTSAAPRPLGLASSTNSLPTSTVPIPETPPTPLPKVVTGIAINEIVFPNGHDSIAQQYLTSEIFDELSCKRTCMGNSLQSMCKAGIVGCRAQTAGDDIAAGAFEVGAFLTDEYCVDAFMTFLSPMLEAMHEHHRINEDPPVPELSVERLELHSFDCVGANVTFRRNITGYRFTTSATNDERQQIESRIAEIVASESWSCGSLEYHSVGALAPNVMKNLKTKGLTDFPDTQGTAAGMKEDWPMNRGVFLNESQNVALWVNSTDHVVVKAFGEDLVAAFAIACDILITLERSITWATHEKLGALSADLRKLGHCVEANVRIPCPVDVHPEIESLDIAGLVIRKGKDYWTISNEFSLGLNEAECIQFVLDGVMTILYPAIEEEDDEHGLDDEHKG
eukprot:TRINITY_DN10278_c0_g1_i1.p1 TRINITY_DN10278_c0_g1~~TRINITY_DN10278_c0_g1_i1.p1  ORF type:complete len:735 (+),score=243.06 TRINITY_DN10278_c0_g1_i1:112-2316(+)